MRCTTNIYLTALAIADLIYLLCVFVLSIEHYPNIHHYRYELYWRLYGLSHWFTDATSYTSIWLTVSFTIERFIAVCHPIRGKMLCTESRAKRVIAVVTVLCFLTTVSTSFEYQLVTEVQNVTLSLPENLTFTDNVNFINSSFDTNLTEFNNEKIFDNNTTMLEVNCTAEQNLTLYCRERISIHAKNSYLGNNQIYRTVFYWFTFVVFVAVPLTLLATFNCFLVAAVHRSHKQRGKMTNQQSDTTLTQENRITIILIAVVLLFLFCQTPMAGMMLYDATTDEPESESSNNLKLALGNIFNVLVNVNAACNFLLYCALSDKYRRTFRAFFFNRGTSRMNTIRSSSRLQTIGAPSNNGLKRHVSEYSPRSMQAENNARAQSLICRRQTPK